MKAIDTEFDGYLFRSRIEARWAKFFKTLGIPYEYEKEGYNLMGRRYLVDFWLPNHQYWIEIKGEEPTQEEQDKARLLAIATGKKVFIFHGNIWQPGNDDTFREHPYGDKERPLCLVKKGAHCYYASDLNIIGDDPNNTCPCRYLGPGVTNPAIDHTFERCPNTTNLELRGRYDHLIRAMYLAEFSFPYAGDSCALRMTADGELEYLVYAHRLKRDDGVDMTRIKTPLPSSIKEYEDEFKQLLVTRPPYWEWRIGAVGGLYDTTSVHRWCECPRCGKLEITSNGETCFLSCGHYEPSHFPQYNDDSPHLSAAYTAARKARFEHGAR